MDMPRLYAKDDHLSQSKSDAETAEHGQSHALALGSQDGLADEMKDRSFRSAAQNRAVKKTEDRAVGTPARAAGGCSFDQLTDPAAIGKGIGQKGAGEHREQRIAAGPG